MAKHVLLDNVSHKNLCIRRDYGPGQGYDVQVARVFPVEFMTLQAEYPLFFIKSAETGDFEPVALLGFTEQENLFLGENGWLARQLPMTIERIPFLIGFQEREDSGLPVQVPVVHVDIEHSSVSEEEGEKVFLAHGGETPFLERITSILMTVHQGHAANKVFSKLLVGLELIESVNLSVEFNDGSKQSLQGLYTINEETLRGLNSSSLRALHEKGHLQDIYMMLASMPNLVTLIDRKNQRLQP